MPSSEAINQSFTVSEFLDYCNNSLDYAYHDTVLEGEVASFKVNQGKWVFFDLKDDESSLGCFLPLWDLHMPLEDGMKVKVKGTPKITKWGKFSFTVRQIMPVGEGSIKKSFELLKKKLATEGLFDSAKKRSLPDDLSRLGVISSTQAAGYADFIKILNERWGGLTVKVAHTGVQGLGAAEQIVRALQYFNEQAEVQVIAILRGGGSADDLAVFNDETLVRAIAASRIPVITGIGHEVDESLSDLAADIRASTPSNAAQMLTPDRQAELANLRSVITRAKQQIFTQIGLVQPLDIIVQAKRQLFSRIESEQDKLASTKKALEALNPERVLRQGYAILSGKIAVGQSLAITTHTKIINAEVTQISARKESK